MAPDLISGGGYPTPDLRKVRDILWIERKVAEVRDKMLCDLPGQHRSRAPACISPNQTFLLALPLGERG